MKNKMEDVAKLLGVELEEEFEIVGSKFNPFTITHEGLNNCVGNNLATSLRDLLSGQLEIVKPLLTKEEKEYLENVLRPYKDNVEKTVMTYSCDGRFLRIVINRGTLKEKIGLPYILEGDLQFKGLENGNCYKPEELGLFRNTIS